MTKKELMERFAERGYTKKDSVVIVNDVFDTITEALVEGKTINIHGFGIFKVIESNPRDIVTPHGEKMTIPGYKQPKFNAGAHLKRCVREGIVREA